MRKTFFSVIGLGVFCGLLATAVPAWAGVTETPAGSGNWVVSNTGDSAITATGGSTVVVEAGAVFTTEGDGITLNSDGYTVTNNGTIDANGDGIVSGSNGHTIINNGTITGDSDAITFCTHDLGASGDDTLINAGAINGNVLMGDGNDTVTLEDGSVIKGYLAMGKGNDLLTINGTVDVQDYVYIGEGNDTLLVTEGASVTFRYYSSHSDQYYPSTVYFGSGNDTITVASGASITADEFRLGPGNDIITVASGATVNGDVQGKIGNDIFNIYGTVNGDPTGGKDADTFNLYSGAQINGDICGGDGTEDGEDLDTLNLFGAGSLNGQAEDFEYFNKHDEGTWVMAGNSDTGRVGHVMNDVTIYGGTLQIDAHLQVDGTLAVLSGGTLSGSGTTRGLVTNGGNLNPGSSVGTLTIEGDYTQNADGNLTIEISASDAADRLDVTGTATLDGSLTVVPTADIGDGSTYTIIGAGTVAGEFAAVNDDLAMYAVTVEYAPSSVDITTTRKDIATVAHSAGQATLAGQLDALIESGGAEGETGFLYPLTEGEMRQTLDAVSPEQHSAMADAVSTGGSLYRSALTGRMNNMHLAFGASRPDNAVASNTVTEYGPALARLPAFERPAGNWSTWVRILGQTAEQDGSGGQQGFKFDTAGLSFGVDKQLTDNLVVGLSAGTLETDINFDNSGQWGDVEAYHVGLYGTYSTAKFYVDTALTCSFNDYDSKRTIHAAGVTARGDTDGQEYTAYVGLGYNLIEKNDWYLVPTMALEYSRVDIDSFTEKGAGALNLAVADYDSDSLVATLGGRLGMITTVNGLKVEPELSLEWAHEFGDLDRDVKARFAGTSGAFTVKGIEPERDSLLVGVGVNLYANEQVTLGFDYNGEFREDFHAHQISADFRYNF